MMYEDFELSDIDPQQSTPIPTATQVVGGIPIPPIRLLQTLSPEEWETFTEEWLTYYKGTGTYHTIRRYSGPGDLGLDVVAFTSKAGFSKAWDSYQCKYYARPLRPTDICPEIAKILYHSFYRAPPFNQAAQLPTRHIFVSPKGVGLTVGRWLKDPPRFKTEIRRRWDTQCSTKIQQGVRIQLTGRLLAYFESFDFSIFEDKTGAELIEEHSYTVFHVPRFGGGLPPRGAVQVPPRIPTAGESMYLRKLLDAYGDHLGVSINNTVRLPVDHSLRKHYDRQRVLFYSAESLRNFARDRTPIGTFDSLQEDVYYGVIDVCEGNYGSGLDRLRSVISTAGSLSVAGNALGHSTQVADKQGVCHQLANDCRLTWVQADAGS